MCRVSLSECFLNPRVKSVSGPLFPLELQPRKVKSISSPQLQAKPHRERHEI